MPLSRSRKGTYPEASSYATCQVTLGHSRLSSLSHCGLILPPPPQKKKKCIYVYITLFFLSGIGVTKLISTFKKKRKEKKSAGWD